ncbi:unnamed protein product [Brassica oleracea]
MFYVPIGPEVPLSQAKTEGIIILRRFLVPQVNRFASWLISLSPSLAKTKLYNCYGTVSSRSC